MGVTLRMKDVDRGWAKRLKHLLRVGRQKPVLTVGIHDEQGGQDAKLTYDEDGQEITTDATLAEVAAFHEFGLGVPRRSFIADWADENHALHIQQIRKIAQAVARGKFDAEVALERLGVLFVAQIQKRIAAGIEPPLSEETIKRKTVGGKRGNVPLINTGQLRSSITYKVTVKKR